MNVLNKEFVLERLEANLNKHIDRAAVAGVKFQQDNNRPAVKFLGITIVKARSYTSFEAIKAINKFGAYNATFDHIDELKAFKNYVILLEDEENVEVSFAEFNKYLTQR